ncbi:MAG: FmdB family zinc ribbon protein [Candidatus Izemoplasmatales bacterium]|jgi:putative FmdB family regulatory protein
MYYDYDCPNCGRIEVSHKIGEKLEECPNCGSKEVEMVITGGNGFMLKGSCWAKDGYTKG